MTTAVDRYRFDPVAFIRFDVNPTLADDLPAEVRKLPSVAGQPVTTSMWEPFYWVRFQSKGLLGHSRHVANQSRTNTDGGKVVNMAAGTRMIANARTDSASARARSLHNVLDGLLISRVGIRLRKADRMPLRIVRVLAQTPARHLLESGPKQTLFPFPEGNWVIKERLFVSSSSASRAL
jgi:hypothetical protein